MGYPGEEFTSIGDELLREQQRFCSRFLIASLAVGMAGKGLAAVPLQFEGTSLPFFELALLDYQPQFRRIVAQTVIGNVACAPASETIPAGTYSLRLDGRDYRLSNLSSGPILRYDLGTGRVLVRSPASMNCQARPAPRQAVAAPTCGSSSTMSYRFRSHKASSIGPLRRGGSKRA